MFNRKTTTVLTETFHVENKEMVLQNRHFKLNYFTINPSIPIARSCTEVRSLQDCYTSKDIKSVVVVVYDVIRRFPYYRE